MHDAALRRRDRVPLGDAKSHMIYLKWTSNDLATLDFEALYTEVDEDGWVQRELGVGDDGAVEHRLVPCDARPGWFGLARLAMPMLQSNVSKAEFESLWAAGHPRAGRQLPR